MEVGTGQMNVRVKCMPGKTRLGSAQSLCDVGTQAGGYGKSLDPVRMVREFYTSSETCRSLQLCVAVTPPRGQRQQ
jgi:hypothetical protein